MLSLNVYRQPSRGEGDLNIPALWIHRFDATRGSCLFGRLAGLFPEFVLAGSIFYKNIL